MARIASFSRALPKLHMAFAVALHGVCTIWG